jgi:hypothetical protein
MIDWTYRKKKISASGDLPKDAFGFVYEIEFDNGMKYLGQKFLWHKRTLKPLKGYKRKRKTVVESDWFTYNGSIKDPEIATQIKNGQIKPISRIILKVCDRRKQLSYFEVKYMFVRDCLEKDNYYNSNILGKFFKKDTK